MSLLWIGVRPYGSRAWHHCSQIKLALKTADNESCSPLQLVAERLFCCHDAELPCFVLRSDQWKANLEVDAES